MIWSPTTLFTSSTIVDFRIGIKHIPSKFRVKFKESIDDENILSIYYYLFKDFLVSPVPIEKWWVGKTKRKKKKMETKS